MRRSWPLLIIAVLMLSLVSCKGQDKPKETSDLTAENSGSSSASTTFNIRYELGNTAKEFIATPFEAKAGETVEVRTGILLDADIHVYLDGQEINKTHYDSDYWEYSFTMPERDVLISAEFYMKGEIWGTPPDEPDTLRKKYPEYFDLPTGKGLEVYVWQLAPESYSFGLMEGTNREKTLEELMNMKSASAEDMKLILSSYDIDADDVIIIPWQNPVSSYICEYWISLDDEDADALAGRRQAYIDRIRRMLFGGTAAVTKTVRVNWTEDDRIFSCLNEEKMVISSVRHLPVYKIDTKGELEEFKERFDGVLTLDQGSPSFNEITMEYDDQFFSEYSLVLAYVTAGSGSLRFEIRDAALSEEALCLNIVQANHPEVGTADMAGWLMIAEISKADLETVTEYDAVMAEG